MIEMASLFDGIGGFPLAGERYGIKTLWASEIEAFPIAVTKIRFPDMLHVGDITRLKGADLLPIDIVCGGSPCQDVSLAGRRAGLAGERSGLFFEQIRIVKELRSADKKRGRADESVRPRYMVWENVPGAFSSGSPHGEDFRVVLEEICGVAACGFSIPRPPGGRWESSGAILGEEFSIAWRVVDAQYWLVPQRRKRIVLVADFGGHSASKILFEQDRLLGDFTPREAEGQDAASDSGAGPKDTGGAIAFSCNQRDEARDLHDISAAVCAQPGMKQQTFVTQNVDCLTPWDTQQARIFTPDSIAPTVAGADGGGGRNPAGLLLESKECPTAWDVQSRRIHDENGVWPALYGGEGGGHGYVAAFSHKAGANASGIGYEQERSPTLTSNTPSVLCINDQGSEIMAVSENIVGTLRAQMHGHPPIVMGSQQGGAEICEDLCPTITASSGMSGNNTPCVFESHGQDSRFNGPYDIAPTVTSTYGAGGGNQPMVLDFSEPVAYSLDSAESNSMKSSNPHSGCRVVDTARTIDTTTPCPSKNQGGIAILQASETYAIAGNIIGRKEKNGGNGLGVQKGICPTITSTDRHAIFSQQRSDEYRENDVVCTQAARQYKDATDLVCEVAGLDCRSGSENGDLCGTLQAHPGGGYSLNTLHPVRITNLIRRLLPIECERLMNFPDGWTDIPDASDSKRYKALGNSVVVGCMEYVLRGIVFFLTKESDQ